MDHASTKVSVAIIILIAIAILITVIQLDNMTFTAVNIGGDSRLVYDKNNKTLKVKFDVRTAKTDSTSSNSEKPTFLVEGNLDLDTNDLRNVSDVLFSQDVSIGSYSGKSLLTLLSENMSAFSGSSVGLVPTASISDSAKFLRGDGTWSVAVSEMTGADGVTAGTGGTVPQPAATDNKKYLRGDGTWSNTTLEEFTTITAPSNTDLTLTTSGTGRVKLSETIPVNDNDVVVKSYVDNFSQGIVVRQEAYTKSDPTNDAFLSSGSTYNNGSDGVGATLTATSNGVIPNIGGLAMTTTKRVLVDLFSGVDEYKNGVYTVTDVGSGGTPWVLTRATDLDGSPAYELKVGVYVEISNGDFASQGYVLAPPQTLLASPPVVSLVTGSEEPMRWVLFHGASTSLGNTLSSIEANVSYPPAANSFLVGDGSDWKLQTLASTQAILGVYSWVMHSMFKAYKVVTNATDFYDEDMHLIDEDNSNYSTTRSSRNNYLRGALTNHVHSINTRSFYDSWGVMYKNTSTTLSYAITVDLESSLTIERMVIGGILFTTSGIHRPTGVKLEHSANDSSWTTLVDKTSLTTTTSTNGMWRAMFSISPTTNRYWRITMSCTPGLWVSVYNVQLWGRSENMTLPMNVI